VGVLRYFRGIPVPGCPVLQKLFIPGIPVKFVYKETSGLRGGDRWEEVNENGDTVVAKVTRDMVSGEVMMSGGIPWTREMIPAVI
jgi:hypothetical protein